MWTNMLDYVPCSGVLASPTRSWPLPQEQQHWMMLPVWKRETPLVGAFHQTQDQRACSAVRVATVTRKVALVIVRGGVSATQAGLGRTAVKVLYNWEPSGWPACMYIAPHWWTTWQYQHTSHSSSFNVLPYVLIFTLFCIHHSVRRQLLFLPGQPCCQAGHSSEYHCCHCPSLHGAHCPYTPREIDK